MLRPARCCFGRCRAVPLGAKRLRATRYSVTTALASEYLCSAKTRKRPYRESIASAERSLAVSLDTSGQAIGKTSVP